MVTSDRAQWRLTPSQQLQYDAVRARLSTSSGRQRPLLLTGDVGVGKTFLARRLAQDSIVYCNIAQDHMGQLLISHALTDLTPEAVVRLVKGIVEGTQAAAAVADGFEPMLSLWAVERPPVLSNFFLALSRVILDCPLLAVIQTSEHVPYVGIQQKKWWPPERCFRLELTDQDKEAVARTWRMDPMRGRVSATLHHLVTAKLEREGAT